MFGSSGRGEEYATESAESQNLTLLSEKLVPLLRCSWLHPTLDSCRPTIFVTTSANYSLTELSLQNGSPWSNLCSMSQVFSTVTAQRNVVSDHILLCTTRDRSDGRTSSEACWRRGGADPLGRRRACDPLHHGRRHPSTEYMSVS